MENHTKKIDQSKFKAIKILLNGGATIREAAEYMQVSSATISYIRNAETYEEYKNTIAAKSRANRKAAQKPQETKPQTTATPVMNPTVIRVEATHYMMEEMRKTNELLKTISAKLAFVVDELCGTGKKEG